MTRPIKSYSIEGIENLVKDAGLPSFRAKQILSWLYEKRSQSYDEMTNLPKAIREQFSLSYPLYNPVLVAKQESSDGTRKYLLEFFDGARAEAVGLPSDDGRLTVCCSTQSGCAMACSFCATGKLGLTRNLEPGEIVDQIMIVEDDLKRRVSNVVMMGQGEPFVNYESSLAAARIINNPKLINIGARHITISTCGVISGIKRFSDEDEQFTLAVSLHSAIQDVRNELMPAMRNQPLTELRQVLKAYTDKTNRRFTFEYALMNGINDGYEDLRALISYARHMLCHVNIIPLNDVEGSEYKPVSQKIMDEWKNELESNGIPATVRRSKGKDIAAACGQLSSDHRSHR